VAGAMMKGSLNSGKVEESQRALFCFHVENYCERSTPLEFLSASRRDAWAFKNKTADVTSYE
jgi:hypothetical protein